LAFEDNPYDGHTLEEHLIQTEYLTDKRPKTGIVDRGYKGKKNIEGTEIILPSAPKKKAHHIKNKKQEASLEQERELNQLLVT
jgi:IS5 family transposase